MKLSSTMYVAMSCTPDLTRSRFLIDKKKSIKSYVLISKAFEAHKSLISEFPEISFVEYGISSTFFTSQKIRPIQQFPQLLDSVISDSTTLLNLLLMSQRFSPSPTSTNQSLSLVLSTLQIAISILDREKPDNIFFPITPHDVFTYSIYVLAKCMSIPCRISKQLSAINNSKAFVVSDIYDTVSWQSLLVSSSADTSSVSKNIQALTSNCLVESYSANSSSSFLAARLTKRNISRKLWKLLYKILYLIGLKKYCYFEYRDYSLSPSSVLDKLSEDKKNEKKFLLLALQYQPEVTSVPMTRPWFTTDQLILFISTYLPKNWTLIVKEHPNMYNWHVGSVINFRNNTLYSMISGLPNVIVAPYQLKSLTAISYSDAVITGTGSVGTEAIFNNKPVLSLGNAPYLGLPNVHSASTFSELSNLLSRLDTIIDIDPSTFLTAERIISELSSLSPNPELELLKKAKTIEEIWQVSYSSSFNSEII